MTREPQEAADMALDISSWSIRKPIPPLVLFVVLIVLGVVSLQTLPITQMPNIDIPIVTITVTQTGAAPSELETQVTKNVENAAAGVVGVKHITSSISDGVSVTTVEFQLETPADRAVNDVRNAMANIRSELPKSIEELSIQRVEVEGMAIVTYAASIPSQTGEQLSWFVDDVIAGALQGVRGVAQVKRAGGVDREIRISLLLDRLMALGITAPDVNEQLRATNVDLAGGRGEVGSQEQTIRMLAGAATVEELANRTIVLPGGRKTKLKEIATVTDGAAEARSFANLNGQPVVAFGIYRAKGFSDTTVAERSSRAVGVRDRQYGALYQDRLSRHHADVGRRRNPGGHRRADFSARPSSDGDFRARDTAVNSSDLLGNGHHRVFAERRQPACDHARHRDPGG
jgi:multidrug efflux pump subunit AcrB